METAYLLLKFLHVVAVIVWVGGVVALVVLNARLGRAGNPAAQAAMGQQSEFFGRAVIGPSMGVALLAGLATAGVGRFPFSLLWIIWGIVGLVLSVLIGGVAVGRTAAQLGEAARNAGPDDPRLDSLRGRLVRLNALNIVLLLSIVWAMVFKPTL